jgi:hypothetical protein
MLKTKLQAPDAGSPQKGKKAMKTKAMKSKKGEHTIVIINNVNIC